MRLLPSGQHCHLGRYFDQKYGKNRNITDETLNRLPKNAIRLPFCRAVVKDPAQTMGGRFKLRRPAVSR
jgi:hypothetical protein